MSMSEATVISLPLTKILPDPENLRDHFDEEDIEALGQNLLEHGQLDPIQVFERGDGTYDLYDGERRWRAAQSAGIQYLTAIVVPRPSPAELVCKKVSRALQTRNLTHQEEVTALEDALNALGVLENAGEWPKAARKLGISPALLRDRMRITKLASSVRSGFESGQLDLSAAQALGRLEDKARQEEVANFIEKNQLHTRFVGTKFIEKLVKHPEKPVTEVYTIALSEQRSGTPVSSAPARKETITDRLEEILADFRRAETWLESAGRENLISQLSSNGDSFGRQRFLESVDRLGAMCRSYITAVSDKANSEELVIGGALGPTP